MLGVGCDRRYLAAFIKGKYLGIDITGQPDLVVNLEHGLPFRDRSFDIIIAFDVFEHLDNIHYVFDELCYVAKQYVIVGLPNMYEWHFRLMFLLDRKLSGKYGLPCDPPVDRHRWLFGLNEARGFVKQRAAKNGFAVVEEVFGYYSYR